MSSSLPSKRGCVPSVTPLHASAGASDGVVDDMRRGKDVGCWREEDKEGDGVAISQRLRLAVNGLGSGERTLV